MLFIKKKYSLNEQHSSTSKTSSKDLICSMKINFLSNGGRGVLGVSYNLYENLATNKRTRILKKWGTCY